MKRKNFGFSIIIAASILSSCCENNTEVSIKDITSTPEKSGYTLENNVLKLRIVDNSERFYSINDNFAKGLNGLAFLMHKNQRKNVFATVGMNLEDARTYPAYGKNVNVMHPPRYSPMTIERPDSSLVRLTQKGEETAGLNFTIDFKLHGNYIDQTFTMWPDHDIDSCKLFLASYMNQVVNTSLFMKKPKELDPANPWIEVASAGHGGMGEVFERPINPKGMQWHEFYRDNPLLRQAIYQSPETLKATKEAGFTRYYEKRMDHFYFGLVDEYMYLMIFKEPQWIFWISASGAQMVRSPAWDYEVKDGPQKAGEKKKYHVRLVYKPYVGIEDVYAEVDKFLEE